MKEDRNILKRAYLLYVLLLIFGVVVIGKVISIQFFKSAEMEVLSARYNTKVGEVDPVKGNIYASDGESMLATSIPVFDICWDPMTVKDDLFEDDLDSLAYHLSTVDYRIKRSHRQWREKLYRHRDLKHRYVLLFKNVRYDVLQNVKKFPILRKGQYKGGFIVEESVKREKLYEKLASRTIGKVEQVKRRDTIVTSYVGIEGAFDKELKGVKGKRKMRMRGGKLRPASASFIKSPIPGKDIYSTIDINIQDVAHNALLKQLKEQNAKHGCVVLMEVETGYVKAISNLTKRGNDYYEGFNWAIGTKTEPGSTFKLASLIVALEDGRVSLEDTVNANGVYKFYDRKLKDSHAGGYGEIDLQRAFEVSSNVISKVINDAYSKDPKKFVEGLKRLGLDQKLGIDLKGEPMPTIKNPGQEDWWGTSLPWMSIGYELEITPLQTLALYNAVANGGKMVRPQFVKEIREGDMLVKEFKPIVLNEHIASPETIAKARKLLEGVVQRGTAKNVRVPGVAIAGKTGTARIAQGSDGYGRDSDVKHQASFAGYFPADNPKYSCIVVIAAPSKNIYGSIVSGSVFRDIAKKVYSSSLQFHEELSGVNKNRGTYLPVSMNGDKLKIAKVFEEMNIPIKDECFDCDVIATLTGEEEVRIVERNIKEGFVPNVIGMGAQDAIYLLEEEGLVVRLKGSGTVKTQSIRNGTKIESGREIIIRLL